MIWWNDLFTILLWVCPLIALLTGVLTGLVSGNWGFGLLTGATTIVLPLLMVEVSLRLLAYVPIYGLIGLLGSILGWRVAKFYTQSKSLTENYSSSDTIVFPDHSS